MYFVTNDSFLLCSDLKGQYGSLYVGFQVFEFQASETVYFWTFHTNYAKKNKKNNVDRLDMNRAGQALKCQSKHLSSYLDFLEFNQTFVLLYHQSSGYRY